MTDLDVILWRGIASGYLVALHIIITETDCRLSFSAKGRHNHNHFVEWFTHHRYGVKRGGAGGTG